ncbi:MAG: orotate phosphoribosyltransferase [bacterium]
MTNSISLETAKILLDIKAVVLSPQKPIRFTSGILSPIYVDNRLLCSQVAERERIIELLVQTIREKQLQPDVLAGTSTAGIPHAAWIADAMKLPMVYVRSTPKGHGMGKQIEGGLLSPTQNVLVVEDMISTAKSSAITINAVRIEGGAQCKHVIAIYTHEMLKAATTFSELGVGLTTLTNFSDLVHYAVERGFVKQEDKDLVLEWNKNPQAWTEKMEPVAQAAGV